MILYEWNGLASAVVELWQNPSLRQQQVTSALRYISAHSWEKIKTEYLSIVDALQEESLERRYKHA